MNKALLYFVLSFLMVFSVSVLADQDVNKGFDGAEAKSEAFIGMVMDKYYNESEYMSATDIIMSSLEESGGLGVYGSCSGGGGTCTCSAGETCTANSSGCSCRPSGDVIIIANETIEE